MHEPPSSESQPLSLPPPPSGETERHVHAALGGDTYALSALVGRVRPQIHGQVSRLLGARDADRDDLAQTILLEVLRCMPSFRGEGSFRAWIRCIGRRVVFGYIKRRAEERRCLAADQDPSALLVGDQGSDGTTMRGHLVHALEALPDEQQIAVWLHHVAGWTVPEVAERLAVPIETARSRLRLAMQRLRADLDADLS